MTPLREGHISNLIQHNPKHCFLISLVHLPQLRHLRSDPPVYTENTTNDILITFPHAMYVANKLNYIIELSYAIEFKRHLFSNPFFELVGVVYLKDLHISHIYNVSEPASAVQYRIDCDRNISHIASSIWP